MYNNLYSKTTCPKYYIRWAMQPLPFASLFLTFYFTIFMVFLHELCGEFPIAQMFTLGTFCCFLHSLSPETLGSGWKK